MRFRFLAVALLAALPVHAQAPSQFRASAPLTLEGEDALHQVELPYEAYRDARNDLADIRIFNAAGESVPFAWAGKPDPTLESAPPIDLPIFPVSKVEPATAGPRAEVTVRAADGTLVSVKSRGAPAKAATVKPAAWLLDASKSTENLKALVLNWQAGPGNEMVTVRVESSEDLKGWKTLAAAPLVRLESGGRILGQPRVDFTPQKVKYFRLTADSPAFQPISARAEHEPRGKLPARHARSIYASQSPEGELVYDLGARLPIEALRLVPQQDNAVLSASIFTRDDPKQGWRQLARGAPFYRLKRDGADVTSPVIEIGRRPARYWMMRLDPGSSTGTHALEVHWQSDALVFVAQGEAPFHLAFGNATAPSTALPLTTLVPQYERGKERKLEIAKVGPVRQEPPPSRWDNLVGSMNPRRIALWAILVGGVIGLGFMAWRLSKQVR